MRRGRMSMIIEMMIFRMMRLKLGRAWLMVVMIVMMITYDEVVGGNDDSNNYNDDDNCR